MNSVTNDNPRFVLISDPTDANAVISAVYKIFSDGHNVCVLWQPPNPFAPGYLPYPQIPLPEENSCKYFVRVLLSPRSCCSTKSRKEDSK